VHPVHPDPTRPGEESVWNYSRPLIAEVTTAHVLIRLGGMIIAETRCAMRRLETSYRPSYYIPPEDVAPGSLVPAEDLSFCEWKGHARYFDVSAGSDCRKTAAWSYPGPTAPITILRCHVAFYAGAMDACFVDGERVIPQPGGYYGGWITSAIAGPFKGVPRGRFW